MTMTGRSAAVGRLALTAGAGWLAWRGLAVDPYALEETHHEWRLPTLPRALDGLTVCHLSDLHSRRWGRRERDLSESLAKREPDLYCLTGDYADSEAGAEAVLRLCSGLRARLGTFAVWGNHEYQEHFDLPDLRRRFADAGVTALENDHALFPAPHAGSLAVAGVDCCDVGRADLGAALAGLPADAASICSCPATPTAGRSGSPSLAPSRSRTGTGLAPITGRSTPSACSA